MAFIAELEIVKAFVAGALLSGLFTQVAAPITVKPGLSASRGLADFDLDGNGEWSVRDGILVLEKPGKPGGAIRRPAALAILKSPPLGSLTYSVDVRSTAPIDLA